MVATGPVSVGSARFWLASSVVLVLPLALLFWLLGNPEQNLAWVVPFGHFVVVTNVAVVAVTLALFIARAAVQLKQHGVLFVALGFMSMAGLFAVHALATPGMITHGYGGDSGSYGDYGYGGEDMFGISAYLSLFVPALFFTARFTSLPMALEQRFSPIALIFVVGATLLLFGILSFWRTDIIATIPASSPPISYVMTTVTLLLLAFAVWHQAHAYLKSRLPMQSALMVAFLFLADAQVCMVFASAWTLAWWEYHILMLLAVVVAVAALFLELDRRRGLERFLSAPVIERVLSGQLLRLGGERRVATILFADLRDSTALAEKMAAENVVEVLNAYLGALARCVFAEMGVLDKFLGDGLMAIFGLVEDPYDGAAPAARATLAMRRGIERLNEERAARGEPPIGFGVGVHTGEVVVGAIGLAERSDYTAIGDTVNTASRLQGLCKQFKVDAVLSEGTGARLKEAGFNVRELGAATVQGKTQPLRVWTLA